MRAFCCLSAACLLLSGCLREVHNVTTRYHLHGVIVSLDGKDHVAKIKHEEIKGFMGAMTMDYPVKSADEFAKLRAGETVDATLSVENDADFWLQNLKEAK